MPSGTSLRNFIIYSVIFVAVAVGLIYLYTKFVG